MWDFCTVQYPVARKEYHCQASEWIDNTIGWDECEYDEEDRPVIRKAREEGCKILKGTEYVKVSGKWEGDFYTFHARKDLNAICHKYELYAE